MSAQGELRFLNTTLGYHLIASFLFFVTFNSMAWHPQYLPFAGHLIAGYPIHFLINWVLFYAFSYVTSWLLPKKIWHFSILSLLLVLWSVVNRAKAEAVHTHLLFSDFEMIGQGLRLNASYLSTERIVHCVLVLLLGSILIYALRKYFFQGRLPRWNKISAVVSTLGFVLAFIFLNQGRLGMGKVVLTFEPHVPLLSAERNGFVVVLLQATYNQKNFLAGYPLRTQLREQFPDNPFPTQGFAAATPACNLKKDPDIVTIMVESLFDPFQIPGLHFSEDPLAPLRDLGYSIKQGGLVVPVYGGGTANTEFEFLTGATHRFFPAGSIQYQHHIRQKGDSLARLLKLRGYSTHAIHNNTRAFWKRDQVYPLLGFDDFHGSEDLGEDLPQYPNGLLTDSILSDFVPEMMKKKKSPQGSFYFVVTVGTHGAYFTNFWPKNERVKIRSDVLSPSTRGQLGIYANLLRDSSKSLELLIRRSLDRPKPTIVVLFGDHLPSFQELVFQKTGYARWVRDTYGLTKQYEKVVPLMVLNNYNCPIEIPPLIGSNCLASTLMEQFFSTKELPSYWAFNRDFCSKHPFILEANPEALKGEFSDYAAFIYQALFKWKDLIEDSPGTDKDL